MNPLIVTVSLAVICVASLAAAVMLQWQDIDATQAWAGFIASLGILTGQQMETPTSRGVGK